MNNCIAQLIQKYNIFIPIIPTDRCELFLTTDTTVQRAIILPTVKSSVNQDMIRLTDYKGNSMHHGYDVVVVSVEDRVYVIPVDDIYNNNTLTLGEKKNCYLLNYTHASKDIAEVTLDNIKKLLGTTATTISENGEES